MQLILLIDAQIVYMYANKYGQCKGVSQHKKNQRLILPWLASAYRQAYLSQPRKIQRCPSFINYVHGTESEPNWHKVTSALVGSLYMYMYCTLNAWTTRY